MSLIEVKNISKTFVTKSIFRKPIVTRALSNVNLTLNESEVLGLVGESGCGKTTLGKTMGKIQRQDEGRIFFDGVDISDLAGEDLRKFRKNIQFIFQDSKSALNPHYKIKTLLREPFLAHTKLGEPDISQRVSQVIQSVGLDESLLDRYAASLSGGEAQRVGIAMSLLLNPKLIIADEPVSSLDVSIQAEVLNTFLDIKEKEGLTMLFITHNLNVCKHICDRIAVMYFGNIVEIGRSEDVYYNPKHPYSKILLSSAKLEDLEMEAEIVRDFQKFKKSIKDGVALKEHVFGDQHAVYLPY